MHLLALGTCVCSRVNESDIGTRPLHNKLSVEAAPQQGSMGSRVYRLEDLRGPEGTRGCKQMECGDPTRKQNTCLHTHWLAGWAAHKRQARLFCHACLLLSISDEKLQQSS